MEENTLKKQFELYEKGGERPTVKVAVKLAKGDVEDSYKVTLTKEIVDRDGEVVLVKGIAFENPENGVPLIDAHNMNGSVVDNVLGRVFNLRKAKQDGVTALVGDVKFAESPRGFIAKMLVEGGFVDSVSIGFGVVKYDPDTRIIEKSELYETSLVAVPANPQAKFNIEKALDMDKDFELIEKKLSHYNEIQPAFKDVCKTFLSDTFCKTIGYEKTGNLILDINKIYDISLAKWSSEQVETPQPQQDLPKVETPQVKTIDYTKLSKLLVERLTKQTA